MADCLRGCEKRQSRAASSCGCFQASTEPKDHQVAGACARGGTAMTSKGRGGRNKRMPALFSACARRLGTDRAMKGFKLLSVSARGIRMGVTELSELQPHRNLGGSQGIFDRKGKQCLRDIVLLPDSISARPRHASSATARRLLRTLQRRSHTPRTAPPASSGRMLKVQDHAAGPYKIVLIRLRLDILLRCGLGLLRARSLLIRRGLAVILGTALLHQRVGSA